MSSTEQPALTLFMSTTDGGLAMARIAEPWVQKVEQLAKFACENKVNISIPTFFWLAGDDNGDSCEHEAVIIPGPKWNADIATIQFAAFADDEASEKLMGPEIGISELQSALASGDRELCIDFGTEELTVEQGMYEFDLVRDENGVLVEATHSEQAADRVKP